jgi:hypothetical protein
MAIIRISTSQYARSWQTIQFICIGGLLRYLVRVGWARAELIQNAL